MSACATQGGHNMQPPCGLVFTAARYSRPCESWSPLPRCSYRRRRPKTL